MKKKSLIFIMLALSGLLICIFGCSSKYKIEDLSQAARIEVRIFSSGNDYTDLVISDKDTIKNISDTLCSLELKNVNIVKPRMGKYEIRFFKGNEPRPFQSFTVGADNVIETGSEMYKITNGINIVDYLSNILENAPED